ncbi:MAG TPA: hypothetical protein DEB17_11495 [Chlorobaculum sp.]|uniref:Uncharacterized protein n=1 Tax=Chlorobaculum tepidum (strain ATCC 49652 / DSM 12025 / NBRC 103806 / TLS) TaxID=194439 RepID=Q8KCT8_CHLTE|nr:hypothetical protein CT1322 [Chlorobaculum tepidum TLS]HBU24590.1 hypothetical protein [Chlorobaculum sp.]
MHQDRTPGRGKVMARVNGSVWFEMKNPARRKVLRDFFCGKTITVW